MVAVRTENLRAQSISGASLRLFRTEELAARIYWKERQVYPIFLKKNGLKIVMVGFGNLGEELPLSGLQTMIFASDQKVEYHIFGEGEEFCALHPQLNQISDKVEFYGDSCLQHRDFLEQADLVIILQQKDQAALVSSLMKVLCREKLDVFAENPPILELLNQGGRLEIFDWRTQSQKLSYILDEELLLLAKSVNLRYAHIYADVAETPENRERQWDKLDTFTRYSNISAADYHEQQRRMLDSRGIPPEKALADEEILEELSQLEHIRWYRYHYLQNWTYGVP